MLTTTGTVAADVRRVRERARLRPMTEARDRHIDIAFVAERATRRERLVAAASAMLWEWRTDIRFAPTADGDESSLADARIMLNVHADDGLALEWERVAGAIANGCVVVSETSCGLGPLVPGVHFVMAPYENVVEQAVALAFDEPRRVAMAEAAGNLELPQLAPIAEVAPARSRLRRSRSATSGTQSDTLHQMVSEMKIAIVAQRELTRSIEATISLVEHGDPNHADTIATSAWASFDAEVSVVVPLYDRPRNLRETVESVMAASGAGGVAIELLIVDDHSTDDSRELSERLLGEIDWFPVRLLAQAAHGGPAVARNAGLNAARASHVMSLDVGSTLYPTGLRRLIDRLQSAPSDVVATYGLVEQFDTTGTLALAGHVPWDIGDLVHGAFPDTIALFRRDRLRELGGYTTPAGGVEDGWEDYDLWLTAAEHGLRAELVGSMIGRSRRPLAAMLDIRNTDIATTFITFRERHPRLPWPS